MFSLCFILMYLQFASLTLNMDGQLGDNGENSLVPHLVEGFLELNSSGSTTDGSETNTETSLKVWSKFYFCSKNPLPWLYINVVHFCCHFLIVCLVIKGFFPQSWRNDVTCD